jgi:bla regulator protein blaR1
VPLHESSTFPVTLLERKLRAMNETEERGVAKPIILSIAAIVATTWFLCPAAPAQTSTAPPTRFEVASVKPAAPGSPGGGAYLLLPGGSFVGRNLPVRRLVMEAYGVGSFQISGGPGWIDSERYDIEAKAEGLAKPDQLSVVMQALLADRFKLEVHRETKDLPIYAVIVGKQGAKIHLSVQTSSGKQGFASRTRIAGDFSMADFAKILAPLLSRSVIDRTGLDGTYELNLQWTPLIGQDGPVPGVDNTELPADANEPPIFSAIQEQLGLQLKSQRGPVDIIIIERVKKPSDN